MPSALALGQLEADASCEQGDDECVDADALVVGSPLDLGVEIGGHSDQRLRGISHSADDSRSVLVSALSDKWAGGATNTPAPAKGWWS